MKYQVYSLAASLDSIEWNQFTREVRQGRLCQHKPTQALVAGLKGHYPAFEVEDTDLYSHLFPGSSFDEARLRVLRTGMKEVLETFFIEKALEKKKGIRNILLLGELMSRGNQVAARRVLESALSSQENHLTIEGMLRQFELHEFALELDIRENKRNQQHDWTRVLDSLSEYSIAQTLRLLCAIYNESKMLNQDVEPFRLRADAAIEVALRMTDTANPIISLYARLLNNLTGRDSESLSDYLREWLNLHGNEISETERLNVLGLWINNLVQGDWMGKPGYLEQTLEAYNMLLESGRFFNAGSFSVHSARNAVAVASRLGETAWGRSFLQQAEKELNPADLPALVSYAHAYLDFSEGNLTSALHHLREAPLHDPFYRLACDLLLLRIWYEKGEDDLFLSLHTALIRQLYRKEKVTGTFRKSIQSFLSVIGQLHSLRSQTKRNPDTLKGLCASIDWMTLREWVDKEIRKLMNDN
jgi:tetratricopeptide (TPR) repeat protein